MCVCGTSASNEFGNTPCFKGPPSEVPPTANMNSFSTLQQLSHAPVDCLTVAAVATMKEQHGLAGLGSRHWGGGLLEGLVPQSLLEKKPGSRHPTCPTSVGDFPISGYWDGRPMPRPDKAFSLSRPFLLGTLPDLGSGGPSSTLLLDPTHYRIQDHSFETTTAHCSLPMHTCPSDEVGPSPRWCCAEQANPFSLYLSLYLSPSLSPHLSLLLSLHAVPVHVPTPGELPSPPVDHRPKLRRVLTCPCACQHMSIRRLQQHHV